MLKKLKPLLLSLCLLTISPYYALAHPHVFIKYKLTTVFNNDGLSGFKQTWSFDDVTSSMIMEDFDKDKNGKISQSEMLEIEKQSFGNMKQFDYFTQVKLNGKAFKVNVPKDFQVSLANNIITYTFFMPYQLKSTKTFQKLNILLIDKTNFVGFTPAKSPISIIKNRNMIIESPNNFTDKDKNQELTFNFKNK